MLIRWTEFCGVGRGTPGVHALFGIIVMGLTRHRFIVLLVCGTGLIAIGHGVDSQVLLAAVGVGLVGLSWLLELSYAAVRHLYDIKEAIKQKDN